MIREIFMPALSSTMTEGKIVAWEKSPGDWVDKGETVVIVESDKADMDVEAFYEGYLATVIAEAGDTVPVGNAIALLAETEAEIDTAKQQASAQASAGASDSATTATAPAKTAPAPEPIPSEPADNNGATGTSTTGTASGRLIVSPRARKLAKDLKVDLSTIQGSGPHGRIVAQDVERAAGKVPTSPGPDTIPTPAAAPAPAAPAAPTPAPAVAGQVVPMNTLQQAVVRGMVASLSAPTFHVGYTITTDAMDALYKQIKGKGVTMTALLAKAVAVTLQKHPLLNACYADQAIQYFGQIHVAVAVAMDDGGLITPVLQRADQLDIYSLSRAWKDLVARARSKQLQPEEYNSGTFTLSNLGMFGVDRFDAILPPGQGAILAIGASQPTVVANDDGMLGVKRQMQVNITCDHRVIYGAHAAAFLQDLAQLIETNPQSLTL
ncbi:Dihydrolipoyllysine-residue acetyltransferase component of pyruvate dehydrogenase complex [Halomicronema hongdechloris C2206]|uniref:Dihydrolipoamide acetyltransferase component of pyruvate dehydrogenase complex n=1 Tax=Halomicronema hongdechloris C2206 TaxID=1641165 RepID=A0A1Z3HH91_9CYAN|nr:dihydrolipoamide acetyltransferase family protein [Halomicronema hongdechloris]ASC69618.1 Dihydrolipoyllysine-residue acetyltransferase component of pyruvate dehydrogenase complex [Halomicronema hongdechloris C2206]